ncbi:MAG: hypothetical protein WHS44_05900 [Fimbriimonadales bacterium]|nr:MAG: hypothetical protein KatS3mg018_0957 [Fimbriimonadales bacterium]
MSVALVDQASGLRARVSAQYPLRLPVLYADFLLFSGVQVQLPPTTLVWHWRARVAPAVGWDLQSRLHVVGSPAQFDLLDLQRWRALFPQWRLVGRRLELLQIADVACIWLKTGVELTPRLHILLGWLCRSRPQMPIILAGIGSGAAQRLQQWVHSRYPLECLTQEQANLLGNPPTEGYTRLLQWATASQRAGAASEL